MSDSFTSELRLLAILRAKTLIKVHGQNTISLNKLHADCARDGICHIKCFLHKLNTHLDDYTCTHNYIRIALYIRMHIMHNPIYIYIHFI